MRLNDVHDTKVMILKLRGSYSTASIFHAHALNRISCRRYRQHELNFTH
jgi:hypothetical protein